MAKGGHNALRIPYQNGFISASELARRLDKSCQYVRYNFLTLKLNGDEMERKNKAKKIYSKHEIKYKGYSMTLPRFAKYIGKSVTFVRYCFFDLKLNGDQIEQKINDSKKAKEAEQKTDEVLKAIAGAKEKKAKEEKERERIKAIMAKPINPEKDYYLFLSIEANQKNWRLRKEVR